MALGFLKRKKRSSDELLGELRVHGARNDRLDNGRIGRNASARTLIGLIQMGRALDEGNAR